MAATPNLFAHIPGELPAELVELLYSGGGVRCERIVSFGHRSPDGFWYDQPTTELVFLLRGAARLRFADEPSDRELTAGDYLLIAAHRRHRVEWTDAKEPTIWLAVHIDGRRETAVL